MHITSCVTGFGTVVACILATAQITLASTWYVATSGSDGSSGTNWVVAKKTIQAALDLAQNGDIVLASNGVYSTGGRILPGVSGTNRIAITNAVMVMSVNGPSVTTIQGEGPMGVAAVRCAYIGGGAQLVGFTLTNGFTSAGGTDRGGGAYCAEGAVISNCVITGNYAYRFGGGVAGFAGGGDQLAGTLRNCAIVGNSCPDGQGGGASDMHIYNSSMLGNVAGTAGGAYRCDLEGCIVRGNVAQTGGGGGAGQCNMSDCTVAENQAAFDGGGVYGSSRTLNRCTISDNSSGRNGGGAIGNGTPSALVLNNCLLTRNYSISGGGASGTVLNNCTVVGNEVGQYGQGGGTYDCSHNNCVVYFNSRRVSGASDNYWTNSAAAIFAHFGHSCTAPMPNGTGIGNISSEPMFVGMDIMDFRLSASSPCVDHGDNTFAQGLVDLSGNPRIVNGTVDMGAFEFIEQADFPTVSDETVRFSWFLVTGCVYRFEAAEDLVHGAWQDSGGVFTALLGQVMHVETNFAGLGFLRCVYLPQ